MDTKQCLEILELECINSAEELRKAYRKMVKIWHPDRFHGDARSVQIADVKLKEINRAYKHLRAYFDPDQRRRLKTSDSGCEQNPAFHNSGNRSGSYQHQQRDRFSNRNDAEPARPYQYDHVKIAKRPKKSFFGRIALFGVICFFIAISCLVAYFVLNMDRLTSRSMGVATDALETMKQKLEKDLATKTEKISNFKIDTPSKQDESEGNSQEFRPTGNQKYFEIHIKGGTVIMTDAWWYEGDMVMYKQFGGSMGVEKKEVVRIVENN
jgi:curved DNA-binding protein CbpA